LDRRSDYEAKRALPGPGAPLDISTMDEAQVAEAERRRDIMG
jgi:hypothetical protein